MHDQINTHTQNVPIYTAPHPLTNDWRQNWPKSGKCLWSARQAPNSSQSLTDRLSLMHIFITHGQKSSRFNALLLHTRENGIIPSGSPRRLLTVYAGNLWISHLTYSPRVSRKEAKIRGDVFTCVRMSMERWKFNRALTTSKGSFGSLGFWLYQDAMGCSVYVYLERTHFGKPLRNGVQS